MKMKKLYKSILIVTLGVISFQASAKDTLLVWEDVDRSFSIKSAVDAFEYEYDCNVDIKEVPMPAQREQLLKQGPQGNGPDIVILAADMVGLGVKNGCLAPIDFMQVDANNYLPNSVSSMMHDGLCYSVPKTIETLILFYNKKLLPHPLPNFEDYIRLSRQLKSENKYGIVAKWDEFYSVFGIINGYGGYVWETENDGSSTLSNYGLDNEETFNALSLIREMSKQDLLLETRNGQDGFKDILRLFSEDKIAAVINGPWAVEDYIRAGIDFGVSTLPVLPNGNDMTSFLGTKGYSISKWSKHHDLAEKFLRFINQPEYALIRYKESKQVPPIIEVLSDSSLENDELIQVIAEQSSKAVPMPVVPEMKYIWTRMGDAIKGTIYSNTSIKKLLRQAHKQIEADILKDD